MAKDKTKAPTASTSHLPAAPVAPRVAIPNPETPELIPVVTPASTKEPSPAAPSEVSALISPAPEPKRDTTDFAKAAALVILAAALAAFGTIFLRLSDVSGNVQRLDARVTSMETHTQTSFATLETRMQTGFTAVNARMDALNLRIDRLLTDMHRVNQALGFADAGSASHSTVALDASLTPTVPRRGTAIVHPVSRMQRTLRHGRPGMDRKRKQAFLLHGPFPPRPEGRGIHGCAETERTI